MTITDAPATELTRDRWGRPLIVPPEGGKPVGYTRVSTLAKALDDLNNLMAWKARKTAEGLVRRPDLLTLVSGAIANGDDSAARLLLLGGVRQDDSAGGHFVFFGCSDDQAIAQRLKCHFFLPFALASRGLGLRPRKALV